MKIMAITMVKNESDIIESYIRYHINIFDELLILDNTDKTRDIIKSLINEGLPIILSNDDTQDYHQNTKMTCLLNKAIKDYGADLVCVLDVDEFIISDEGENPRKFLERLNRSKYYLAKWVTYIPTEYDDKNINFIPKRITYIRDSKYESFYKVIVPKDIVLNFNSKLTMGNHDLFFANEKPSYEILPNIKIAHFPIRSKDQCISKVSVGWPNMISVNAENKSFGWHWKKIFEDLIINNNLSDYDLESFAKYYALEKCDEEIEVYESPICLDFCENIEIKYDFEYNYLNKYIK